MDSNTQQMLHTMAISTHQKNRSEGMDYVDRWSTQPTRTWIFRMNILRRLNMKRSRGQSSAALPRPALNELG